MSLMGSAVVFLVAAVVAVPIFRKLKLGAILGYLVAGVVIGPSVMDWVNDPQTILHVAELGVVFLLFIIGLELDPKQLWEMRKKITLTGGSQLIFSATFIALMCSFILSLSPVTSLVVGLSVALSSTAFAVQLMEEHRVLKTPPGQQGFSILLMQDVAVIPILLLVASLSSGEVATGPAWWVSVLALCAVLVVGRFLINPCLSMISLYGNSEVMTASALLIVIATALGMQEAGLSMGMGAFVAGILLANSSFKHQLETEIAPFKGLFLGLFFIAIGMNLNLALLVSEPVFILGASVVLVLVKGGVIFTILKMTKQNTTDAVRIGLMLSQGGEFAFVVMSQAEVTGVIETLISQQVTLIVGISMALTSPLVIMHSVWFNSKHCPAVYDAEPDEKEPRVLIAGLGRFGQVSARILTANKIPFIALDKDPEQIEFLKKFGSKVFYGDASRLDLLRTAGISKVKVLLIAIDNDQEALKIAYLVRDHFPDIKIIARAHNRMSVVNYARAGVNTYVREVFPAGLKAAEKLLQAYGFDEEKAVHTVSVFAKHDEKLVHISATKNLNLQQMIDINEQDKTELQSLFERDEKGIER
ncbi:monovalent cation:proton antiporter-2 (CPA2) family protein [Paraglaciecola mesophila]|uniref:Monovalent cation:proton antiporter-2 (CPA2) family protein n=1 Tax=Paraglaciecola mesophila TaxID=197222 RepID=A0ABU9SW24_9ALTE